VIFNPGDVVTVDFPQMRGKTMAKRVTTHPQSLASLYYMVQAA
jgi:hypothetical protein